MRSRGERITWAIVAAVWVVGSAAAWIERDTWLPEAGPWLQQLWRKGTRPGPDTLPSGKRPAGVPKDASGQPAPPPPPRKCVAGDGHIVYTDQPCPRDTREQAVDGAVTVLPGEAPPDRPRR